MINKNLISSVLCTTAILANSLSAGIAFAQKDKTTVTVEITSIKADSMWVVPPNGSVFFVKPSADRKFLLHFDQQEPFMLSFGIDSPKKGRMSLFVEKGDHLNVTTDFDQKSVFKGKGSENARVLNEYTTAYLQGYLKLDARKMTASEVFDGFTAIGQQSIDILEKNKKKVSPAFYKYQSVALLYQKLGSGMIIPYLYHAGLGKKMSESIPVHFWDVEKQVEMDDKLLVNPEYSRFMQGSFPLLLSYQEKFKKGLMDSTFSNEADTKLKLKLVEKRYTGKVRSVAMGAILKSALANANEVSAVKPSIDEYVNKYASAEDAKSILKAYDDFTKTAAGKTPPPFVLKDMDGKDVTLKDFAGKVIYMDFWASWCSPCRYEMKNGSPKLHEKFKDNKEVVFLYISIDSKADAWRKAIAEDNIQGIHLLSLGGNASPVAKAFNISGIPHYVIIGKDGKIFDNNAPRPSQDITPAKINEALNAPDQRNSILNKN